MAEAEDIERFEEGKMDDRERIAFEEQLRRNPQLQEELDLYRKFRSGSGALKEEPYPGKSGVTDEQPDRVRPFYIRYAWPLAAVVLLVFTFSLKLLLRDKRTFAERHFYYDPGIPIPMGGDISLAYRDAMIDYRNREYVHAGESFERLRLQHSSDTLNYYAGICQLHEKKYASARESFTIVSSDTSSDFHDPALYFLALLLNEEGRTDEAIKVLIPLWTSSNPDIAYLSQAAEFSLRK